MTDLIIVFKNEDGSCGVIHPTAEALAMMSNEDGSCGVIHPTAEALAMMSIEAIARKDVPSGKSYRIVEAGKIPPDRAFREAWTDDYPTDTVDVDMNKAKIIHLNRLRAIRQKKFEALGFPQKINAQLEEATIDSETRNKLNTLRDFTKHIDLNVSTPEALAQIIPDCLK